MANKHKFGKKCSNLFTHYSVCIFANINKPFLMLQTLFIKG